MSKWMLLGPFVVPILLSACADLGGNSADNASEDSKPKPLTGWGPWKFDMPFSEAIAADTSIVWSPYGMDDCRKEMATKGCFLTSDSETGMFQPQDGIPFEPQLSFNKYGRLTDLSLSYDQKNATRDECLELHNRTLDRIAQENGPMRHQEQKSAEGKEYTDTVQKTKGGVAYRILLNKKNRGFITSQNRSHIDGVIFPTKITIDKWNKLAYVMVLGVLVDLGSETTCMISIHYTAPPTLERRVM